MSIRSFDEYRVQAEHCHRMALGARTSELRAGWLKLAAGWLDIMVPLDYESAQDRFDSAVHDTGTGQTHSMASH